MSNITSLDLALVCPACKQRSFTTKTTGLILKSTHHTCTNCGTELSQVGGKNNPLFEVIKVGDDYSNAATLLEGKIFKMEELGTHKVTIASDAQIEAYANGNLEGLTIEMTGNVHPNIILKKDEQVSFYLSPVRYLEERSKRVSSGGSSSFRITKGWWYHSPRISQYMDQIEELDTGVLAITNKRYIFIGSRKNIDQSFTKVTAVNRYTDAVGIARSNKQRTEFFMGNYHWPLIASIISGLVKKENAN